MENYLLTGSGILVSIILFLLGYRQTIGAKKERLQTANLEVEKILIRRVVNEKYDPNIMDISRLIEGKARDYKVDRREMLSESQILNCLYTRIVETDLITLVQREEILSRIIPIIEQAENDFLENDKEYEKYKDIKRETISVFVLIIITALVGGLITTYFTFDVLNDDINNIIIGLVTTLSVSLTLISLISYFKKYKDLDQESTSKSSEIENFINFEKQISSIIIRNFGKACIQKSDHRGYDFSINLNNEKILVEAKSWLRPITNKILISIVERLNEVVIKENASVGIIVTNKPFNYCVQDIKDNKVKIMSLNEFKKYISNKKSRCRLLI